MPIPATAAAEPIRRSSIPTVATASSAVLYPDAYYDGHGYHYGKSAPPSVYVDPYAENRDPYGSRESYNYDPNGHPELREGVNMTTRVEVENPTRQPAGTIVIDTSSRHLYLVEPGGRAMQYGIGVGRQGFAWHGTAAIKRKAEWPGWTPPNDMLKRRPDLPLHMEGGLENPLGARALYLYQGNRDTMFRIHGTNEPDTIGQAVSSGCIRMMNGDVIDLYQRVSHRDEGGRALKPGSRGKILLRSDKVSLCEAARGGFRAG